VCVRVPVGLAGTDTHAVSLVVDPRGPAEECQSTAKRACGLVCSGVVQYH
jgi:hypothetical protein